MHKGDSRGIYISSYESTSLSILFYVHSAMSTFYVQKFKLRLKPINIVRLMHSFAAVSLQLIKNYCSIPF